MRGRKNLLIGIADVYENKKPRFDRGQFL